MLVRHGRRVLAPLLVTGVLTATVAACAGGSAGAEVTGLVIPSAPRLPITPPPPGPGIGTKTPSATTSTTSTTTTEPAGFVGFLSAVTADDVRHTYSSECPVGPSDLSKITMTYRAYDGQVRTGVLIVAAQQAETVVDSFRQAFDAGFRINRMENPDHWNGDEVQMAAADNTSAFNCRPVTGNTASPSTHAYGTAINVNPRRNPHRAVDGVWYPSNGARWVDRSLDDVGMMRSSSAITRAFLGSGATWGGTWADPSYQHFELQ